MRAGSSAETGARESAMDGSPDRLAIRLRPWFAPEHRRVVADLDQSMRAGHGSKLALGGVEMAVCHMLRRGHLVEDHHGRGEARAPVTGRLRRMGDTKNDGHSAAAPSA